MSSLINSLIAAKGGLVQCDPDAGNVEFLLKHFQTRALEKLELWVTQGPLGRKEWKETNFFFLNSQRTECFVYGDNPPQIFLTAGYMLHLSDVFFSVMADPRFFPEIGDVALETLPSSAPPSLFLTRSGAGQATSSHDWQNCGFWRVPHCRTRMVHAIRLSRLSLEFLLNHEFAHISRAHLYLQTLLKQSLMKTSPTASTESETLGFDANYAPPDLIELSQYYENDADAFAVDHLVLQALPPRCEKTMTPASLIHVNAAFFAVSVLFLLANKDRSIADCHTTSYPYWMVRYKMVQVAALVTICRERDLQKNDGPLIQAELAPCVTSLKTFAAVYRDAFPVLVKETIADIEASFEEREAFTKNKAQWLLDNEDLLRKIAALGAKAHS